MKLILASASPSRRALLRMPGLSFEVVPRGARRARRRRAAARSRRAAGRHRAGARDGEGDDRQRSAPRRAGDRRRPDARPRRRAADEAGGHGSGAASAPAAFRQDAHPALGGRLRARRRDRLAACRDGAHDDAKAHAAIHRPLSGGGRRRRRCRASAPISSRAGASSSSKRSRATFFAILGLPLLPLLAFLRSEGVVE